MPGYVTGEIRAMPRNSKLGEVLGDDGTIYFFNQPSAWKSEKNPKGKSVWRGARIRGIAGPRMLLKGIKVSPTDSSTRRR